MREALSADERFDIREVEPDKLVDTITGLITSGTPRILVSGGDGTLASAAGAFVETDAEMAILPGGTLNHFAKRIGLPEEHPEALSVAAEGTAAPQDVGRLNEIVFLNTSSIGAYVLFVQTRDHLEKKFHLPYYIASLLAGIRMLAKLRTVRIEIEVEGERKEYETPLLYIGVGERETKGKSLGQPKEGGRRGLHIMIVQGSRRARLLALTLAAAARGHSLAHSPHLDAFLVDECRIVMDKGTLSVALDGELKDVDSPLSYTLLRDSLKVVT